MSIKRCLKDKVGDAEKGSQEWQEAFGQCVDELEAQQMARYGTGKVFLATDISCGPAKRPTHTVVRLHGREAPSAPEYSRLILAIDNDAIGDRTLVGHLNPDEELADFCGEGEEDTPTSHRSSVVYFDELSSIFERFGYYVIMVDGPFEESEISLEDFRLQGIESGGLGNVGFDLNSDGLVSENWLTAEFAVGVFNGFFTNPLTWLGIGVFGGVGLAVAVFTLPVWVPVCLVVVGGGLLAYAAGSTIDAYTDGSRYFAEADALIERGDLRGAAHVSILGSERRGQAIGGGAAYAGMGYLGSGLLRPLVSRATRIRASGKAPSIGAAEDAVPSSVPMHDAATGRPTWSAEPPDPTTPIIVVDHTVPGYTVLPPPSGSPGPGGFFVPGRTTTTHVGGGLPVAIDPPPIFIPDLVLVNPTTVASPPATTPAASLSPPPSPLPAVIFPPYIPDNDNGIVRREMPGTSTDPVAAPGHDGLVGTIGDPRNGDTTPVGDPRGSTAVIGDRPAGGDDTVYAPGDVNGRRFVRAAADGGSFMDRLRATKDDPYWQQSWLTVWRYEYPVLTTDEVIAAGNRLAQEDDSPELVERVGPFAVIFRSPVHIGPFREAVDFLVPDGTHVLAMADGVVTEVVEHSSRWGEDPSFIGDLNYVTVRHPNGEFSQYCHLAQGSVTKAGVRVGTRVQRGQRIGTVGRTGWTTIEHLHVIVFIGDDNPFGLRSLRIRWRPGSDTTETPRGIRVIRDILRNP